MQIWVHRIGVMTVIFSSCVSIFEKWGDDRVLSKLGEKVSLPMRTVVVFISILFFEVVEL